MRISAAENAHLQQKPGEWLSESVFIGECTQGIATRVGCAS